jgi:MFS family permease
VGIALALMVLPPVARDGGIAGVYATAAAVVAAGLLLVAVFYQPPGGLRGNAIASGTLGGKALAAVLIAGAMWSLYNVAFAMVFGFGPSMLVERGWSVTNAGFAVSIVLWLAIASVAVGGYLADKTSRHGAILVPTFVAFAAALALATRTEAVIPTFVALGLVSGLPAGAIMSLPAGVLQPGTRAIGMGLFFTLHYIGMCSGPAIAGWLAARTGNASTAFDFGVAMLGICLGLWWLYRRVAAGGAAVPSASPAR